jgi:hypothetical protein
MIPQEQPQQVEEIGDAVVDRRRGHEQHAATDDHSGQRTVSVCVGVSKPMSFIDNEEGWIGW